MNFRIGLRTKVSLPRSLNDFVLRLSWRNEYSPGLTTYEARIHTAHKLLAMHLPQETGIPQMSRARIHNKRRDPALFFGTTRR